MSKTDKKNPYLEAHEKASKQLTQLQSDLKILEEQKKTYNKNTYEFKKDKRTVFWNKELGYLNNNGQPTRDLNFIYQDIEKKIAENETALGSRYVRVPNMRDFMSIVGSTGFGISGGGGYVNFSKTNFDLLPQFSKVSGKHYKINPHYIDTFNPEGTAAQDLKIQNDEYGRNNENPNFGVNPNKLESLKIENGE